MNVGHSLGSVTQVTAPSTAEGEGRIEVEMLSVSKNYLMEVLKHSGCRAEVSLTGLAAVHTGASKRQSASTPQMHRHSLNNASRSHVRITMGQKHQVDATAFDVSLSLNKPRVAKFKSKAFCIRWR